jgi:hypothetical protein
VDLKRIVMKSLNYGFEIENSGSSESTIGNIAEIIVEALKVFAFQFEMFWH